MQTFVTSPNYVDNSDRCHGNQEPCAVCGKPIEPSKAKHYVRMHVMWAALMPDEEVEPGYDQGYFPIGTDCLRKHPELEPYAVPASFVWGKNPPLVLE